MAVGDTITAARYNIIQARIAAIIGVGSGDEGYGQARASSTVAVGREQFRCVKRNKRNRTA